MEKTKKCSKCYQIKSLNDFFNHPTTKDKKFGSCKACDKIRYNNWRKNNPEIRAKTRKREYLKKHHRLSFGEFEKMMEEQNNKCYICNNPPSISSDPRTKFLQVDHCHKTGKIRKLLCHLCNRAIGLLKEDPEIMMNAINYIKMHNH